MLKNKNCISKLCETSSAAWKRGMVLGMEWDRDLTKNLESHGEKYVWREISGQEVDKRSNADVGIEWNNRSADKS